MCDTGQILLKTQDPSESNLFSSRTTFLWINAIYCGERITPKTESKLPMPMSWMFLDKDNAELFIWEHSNKLINLSLDEEITFVDEKDSLNFSPVFLKSVIVFRS